MLHVPSSALSQGTHLNSWAGVRASATIGNAVAPAVGSYGSNVQIGADLTAPSYGLWLGMHNNSNSASCRNTALKISIDPAGGTSPTLVIAEGLLCGSASPYTTGGVWYYFPVFIPAGAAVFAQAQGNLTNTVFVLAVFNQYPPRPEMIRLGRYVDRFGSADVHIGTTVTSGSTNEGAWTQMGVATTKTYFAAEFGFQVDVADSTWGTTQVYTVDIAYGDATNKIILVNEYMIEATSTESITKIGSFNDMQSQTQSIPIGSLIYTRVQCSGTPDVINLSVYLTGG